MTRLSEETAYIKNFFRRKSKQSGAALLQFYGGEREWLPDLLH